MNENFFKNMFNAESAFATWRNFMSNTNYNGSGDNIMNSYQNSMCLMQKMFVSMQDSFIKANAAAQSVATDIMKAMDNSQTISNPEELTKRQKAIYKTMLSNNMQMLKISLECLTDCCNHAINHNNDKESCQN